MYQIVITIKVLNIFLGKAADEKSAPDSSSAIITVQVLQDAVHLASNKEITKSSTAATATPPTTSSTKTSKKSRKDGESKRGSRKKSGPKFTTISEDTKAKIRDTIFASMLAKQKGTPLFFSYFSSYLLRHLRAIFLELLAFIVISPI